MTSEIKLQIETEVKAAMRAREKLRLGALRLMKSEIQRVEVDERVALDDERVLAILDKMTKQRRDSLTQYKAAGRDDLAAQEALELDILKEFLPEQMSTEELGALVIDVIAQTGATSMKDMGKVMGMLKPKVQGRADMGEIGSLVKANLS